MSRIKRLLVVGGDMRISKTAQALSDEGYEVKSFGQGGCAEPHYPVRSVTALSEGICDAEAVILGLPCTRDGIGVYMPSCESELSFEQLFSTCPDIPILAGMVPKSVHSVAKNHNRSIIDYFEREELIIANTVPTAEGAIELAMQEMPTTIFGSNCLVVGFGRIGKVLSRYLSALGAKVTATARKHGDLSLIKVSGYHPLHTNDICGEIQKYDIVFNTVPWKIIDQDALVNVKRSSLIIDLASKPGGVDFILDNVYTRACSIIVNTKTAIFAPLVVKFSGKKPIIPAKFCLDWYKNCSSLCI